MPSSEPWGYAVKRREFITVLGGAAVWPFSARAQQPDRMRHIGVLQSGAETDPDYQARMAAFKQSLQQLGWSEGTNVTVHYRWGAGDAERIRRYAAELVELAPDVILTNATRPVMALQQTTRTIPIVFTGV